VSLDPTTAAGDACRRVPCILHAALPPPTTPRALHLCITLLLLQDAQAQAPHEQQQQHPQEPVLTLVTSFRCRQHLDLAGPGLATARLTAADYEPHVAAGTLALQPQLLIEYPLHPQPQPPPPAQQQTMLERLRLRGHRHHSPSSSSGKKAGGAHSAGSSPATHQQSSQDAHEEGSAAAEASEEHPKSPPANRCVCWWCAVR
jgi:hypothetical protein